MYNVSELVEQMNWQKPDTYLVPLKSLSVQIVNHVNNFFHNSPSVVVFGLLVYLLVCYLVPKFTWIHYYVAHHKESEGARFYLWLQLSSSITFLMFRQMQLIRIRLPIEACNQTVRCELIKPWIKMRSAKDLHEVTVVTKNFKHDILKEVCIPVNWLTDDLQWENEYKPRINFKQIKLVTMHVDNGDLVQLTNVTIPRPMEFDPESMDPTIWIENFEIMCKSQNWDPCKWLPVYLRGVNVRWFETFHLNKEHEWSVIKEDFLHENESLRINPDKLHKTIARQLGSDEDIKAFFYEKIKSLKIAYPKIESKALIAQVQDSLPDWFRCNLCLTGNENLRQYYLKLLLADERCRKPSEKLNNPIELTNIRFDPDTNQLKRSFSRECKLVDFNEKRALYESGKLIEMDNRNKERRYSAISYHLNKK